MKCLGALLLIISLGWATTYTATTPKEIQAYTNMLQAGDTLLVQAGHYDMTWNISNLYGNAGSWIVIQTIGNVVIDIGTSGYSAPDDDFNWDARPVNTQWDIGAYEWSQSTNPGWQIQQGFKEIYTTTKETPGNSLRKKDTSVMVQRNVVIFQGCITGDRIANKTITRTNGKLVIIH